MPRAFLENMRPSRARKGSTSRTLSKKEIEERLDALLANGDISPILRLRDEMRQIAPALKLENEFETIDAIIGKYLGTREIELVSDIGRARGNSVPYDAKRLPLFEELFRTLLKTSPIIRPWKHNQNWNNFLFFESYFSNYIEGTEFEVNEAHQIIFEQKIPRNRPQDAHDILSTYQILSNPSEIGLVPKSFVEFETLLKNRHAILMGGRPEKLPGKYKNIVNRVGTKLFVDPSLVRGTLKQGFDMYQSLSEPFHRALFMMFLVAEVHPFIDGNGRIARIMMNAELSAANEFRIIIPTVYRNNYLTSLRALSQTKADIFLRTMDFAQKYTAAIDWSSYETSCHQLEKTHAFMDAADADYNGLRLVLPEDSS